MAKQGLYGFWIGFDTDEERGKTMAQIVKPKTPRIIIHCGRGDGEQEGTELLRVLPINDPESDNWSNVPRCFSRQSRSTSD